MNPRARRALSWLSIAALAWLAAGCSTYADRYGDYDYGHGDDYYQVDEVVYGGAVGYASGGRGYAYDPYWLSSGFAYHGSWPSYYVWAPYYDPFYVTAYRYGPSVYYPPYRHFGGISYFGYYDGFASPWYVGRYGYYDSYGHHGRGHGRYDRYDSRGNRYRGRGQDPGRSARNEAVRLTTTRQPIGRTPAKEPRAGATPRQARPVPRATPSPRQVVPDGGRQRPAAIPVGRTPAASVPRHATPGGMPVTTLGTAVSPRGDSSYRPPAAQRPVPNPRGYAAPTQPPSVTQPAATPARPVPVSRGTPITTRPLAPSPSSRATPRFRPVEAPRPVSVPRPAPSPTSRAASWNSPAPAVTRAPTPTPRRPAAVQFQREMRSPPPAATERDDGDRQTQGASRRRR